MRAFPCSLALLLSLCCFSPAGARGGHAKAGVDGGHAKAGADAWKFEQRCQLSGSFVLILSDIGVKVNIPEQNLVCVSSAPDWQYALVNTKLKIGLDIPPTKWQHDGIHLENDKQVPGPSKTVADTWRGMPALRFTRNIHGSDPLREQCEMLYQASKERSLSLKSEEMLFSNWLELKPPLQNFVQGFYRIHGCKSVMLQHINKYTNGKTNQVLTTTSASRIKVSPSDFKKPCDYRVVQNRDLVTNDAQRRKEIVGVCTDYFLDDKESKKKQK